MGSDALGDDRLNTVVADVVSHPDLDTHLPLIAAGDAEAFARWMAGGAEARIRLSLSSFARSVDVEAVVQEALLRTWQVAPKFTPDGAPTGLVRLSIRIARNAAVSELRKLSTRATAADNAALESDPAPLPPDPLLRETIGDCVEKLPGKPRSAFEARITDRKSVV